MSPVLQGTAEPTSRRLSRRSQQPSPYTGGKIQPYLSGLARVLNLPSTACWATFSRPGIAGTEAYTLKLRNWEA